MITKEKGQIEKIAPKALLLNFCHLCNARVKIGFHIVYFISVEMKFLNSYK